MFAYTGYCIASSATTGERISASGLCKVCIRDFSPNRFGIITLSVFLRTSRPMSPMPNFSQDIADQNSDQNNDDNKLFRSTISVEKADSFEETTDIIEKLDVKKNIDENDVYDKVEITPPLSERRSDKNSLPRDASVDALASKPKNNR